MKKLIIIPTYNEKENIENIIRKVFSLETQFNILIIDDGSPDNTAQIVKNLQNEFSNKLFIEERTGKLGLGTAYIHGFKWALKNNYDFIIIDCSPSLGIVTVNALVASDSVIIPVQCEYFALEGLGKLLETIKLIQKDLNKNLNIEGILMSMYDVRLRLSNQVVEEVQTHFKALVFNTIIPRNVKLSEAPSFGVPAISYDASCKGSISYLNLAKEVIDKNNSVKVTW